MKTIMWVYLALYLDGATLGFAMELVSDRAMYISAIAVFGQQLLPAGVVAYDLKGLRPHFIIVALGILCLLGPIFDAHKFVSIPHVTLAMYILLVPMAVYLFGILYRGWPVET